MIDDLKDQQRKLRDLVESDGFRALVDDIREEWSDAAVLGLIRKRVREAPSDAVAHESVRSILAAHEAVVGIIQRPMVQLEQVEELLKVETAKASSASDSKDWRTRA